MTKNEFPISLTGKTRFRQSFTKKLIVQVEYCMVLPDDKKLILWRDARVEDILPEVTLGLSLIKGV